MNFQRTANSVLTVCLTSGGRFNSTLRTDAMRGSEDCRSGHAASDQDVAKGAGRGAGRKRQTAGERWEGKHLWHAAGRSYNTPYAKGNFEFERRLQFRRKSSTD